MREPDWQGTVARAWRVPIRPRIADHTASLDCVVVNGPFHPIWSWWMLSLISLRDIPGVPPANKHYPEAEFEIMVASIDPAHTVDPDKPPFPHLTPLDHEVQFHGITDDQARDLFEEIVRMIVDGELSPDQDYRSAWRTLVGSLAEARS